MNILVIGDSHEPFCHKNYLGFCKEVQRKHKCKKVVHVGDLVDNHSISYHEHHPDGLSPFEEIKLAKKKLKRWYKAFPELMLCKGNHDILVKRKAITYGLSELVVRDFREIWEIPAKWEYGWNFNIYGVRFEHGTGYSGLYPQSNAAKSNRQSTVIGHCHSVAGDIWSANDKDIIYGLSVGCGIDRKAYSFWYGRDFKNKPILGCGLIEDNGKQPRFIPMEM